MTHIMRINEFADTANKFNDGLSAVNKFLCTRAKRIGSGKRRPASVFDKFNKRNETQGVHVLVDMGVFNFERMVDVLTKISSFSKAAGYSYVDFIPFEEVADKKNSFRIDNNDADNELGIDKILHKMRNNANVGNGTKISACIDCITDAQKTDSDSVWLILSDGMFMDDDELKSHIQFFEKNNVMFCLQNNDYKPLEDNSDYNALKKCYLDF